LCSVSTVTLKPFAMSQKLDSALDTLSMKEIISATGDEKLGRAEKRKRSDLVASMQHLLETHPSILLAAHNKVTYLDFACHSSSTNFENAFEYLTVKEIQCAVAEFRLPYAEK